MQHLSIVQVVGNTGDFVGRKSAMSQHGDSIGLVGKLKTKYYARRARRREAKRLREIMGGQSIYNWRRGKQELLLQKLLQREESSLHTDSRSVSHDTSQRSYTLQDQPSATSAKPTTPKVEKPFDETLHFSFSGGGWLMVYMYGVAKALREQKLHENAKFIGTSAGCLSIVSLVLDSDFDAICDSVINDYVPAAHATWWGPFNMREYLVDAITHHANVNKMDRLNDKVTVVYTSLSGWISRRVSNFKNPIHLLHTMVASCCATPLVGLPFEHEGEFVIDGGLLDNQPLFDSVPTITVSPNIFSDADIRPSRYVPAWWSMYPPSQRDMQWLYDLGYEDALSWCVRQAFPGSERIVVPTTAAEYDGEWKTVVGKVVGYRWVEDMVHVAMKMLDISEEMLERNALRMEILSFPRQTCRRLASHLEMKTWRRKSRAFSHELAAYPCENQALSTSTKLVPGPWLSADADVGITRVSVNKNEAWSYEISLRFPRTHTLWLVQRSYADFQQFHCAIETFFQPALDARRIQLPRPSRLTWAQSARVAAADKLRRQLNSYLHKLLEIESVHSSDLFRDFVSPRPESDDTEVVQLEDAADKVDAFPRSMTRTSSAASTSTTISTRDSVDDLSMPFPWRVPPPTVAPSRCGEIVHFGGTIGLTALGGLAVGLTKRSALSGSHKVAAVAAGVAGVALTGPLSAVLALSALGGGVGKYQLNKASYLSLSKPLTSDAEAVGTEFVVENAEQFSGPRRAARFGDGIHLYCRSVDKSDSLTVITMLSAQKLQRSLDAK
ncbi:hypothetical protein PHYBOEH_007807 [Phytophthora boehmeriae]|uniref:Patatin-like phospholipase n=1 Tax=Phytophthora boehmeriae TaxID=109152 RepID=A0A8T1W8T1_9STRA|nr:hypothetical protein PHYBOEH_007807 [Phytophthora boehmeriae]